jgi:hypothetical protein
VAEVFNVYCDESCHLEKDHQDVMVLGAVWCPLDVVPEVTGRLRDIKVKHGLPPLEELKWTKISPGNVSLYLDIVDYFFDTEHLSFRSLIADKSNLKHSDFGQTHDDWYYKMYFDLLKVILQPEEKFYLYLDIKDTRGAAKIRKLHEVLANNFYDFSRDIVERVQVVRSHEVALIQLADVLTGLVSAANRPSPARSVAKKSLIERAKQRSHYTLTRSTLLREKKFNLFHWQGSPRSTG